MRKMKKLCAVGLAALCLAGGMCSVRVAEASENMEKQSCDQMLYSARMWENNGNVYTVYNVNAEGYTSLSGNYMDTIAVYENKIYWRKNNGEEKDPAPIIRMNLDGSGQEVLAEDAHPSTFLCIDEGFIYYTAADEMGNQKSRRINLVTGENQEAPPYRFRAGNENFWFSTSLDNGMWYCSEPGYRNIRSMSGVNGLRLGALDHKLYYMVQGEDSLYTTCSFDVHTSETEILLRNQKAKSIVSGTGLYYKQENNGYTTLYRKDLRTSEETSYDLGEFHLYMGGGFYELEDKICFTQFRPESMNDNAELWELDTHTGQKRLIGQWYNSNAVNAAKEP